MMTLLTQSIKTAISRQMWIIIPENYAQTDIQFSPFITIFMGIAKYLILNYNAIVFRCCVACVFISFFGCKMF